jgi:hypothetical protein
MKIINDLELSHGFMDSLVEDILDDDLLLLFSLSSWLLMILGVPLLGL